MARDLAVNITGDASSYLRALGRAQKGTSKFGVIAKRALIGGAAAGMTALGVAAKRGWDEYNEGQAVAAQTNAVIKSTGGVANVTAKQVEALANALMLKSTFDDEAIQSGENVLLTFRNIHNEVGKGNDVFNQATQAVLDMATAMDTDLDSAALGIGKALNDPIKGLTRLGRMGVDFTEQQKEAIITAVEHGNVLRAQKIILAELAAEFGGSALAASKTFSGQITILRNRLDNFLGLIVGKAIPYLQRFGRWIGPILEQYMEIARKGMGNLRRAINQVAAVLERHQESVNLAVAALRRFAQAIGLLIRWNLFMLTTVVRVWAKILGVVLSVTDKVIGGVRRMAGGIRTAAGAIASAVGAMINAFRTLWGWISSVIGAIDRLKAAIPGIPNIPDITPGFDLPGVPGIAEGGVVRKTGLAVVHKGEEYLGVGSHRRSGGPIHVHIQLGRRELAAALIDLNDSYRRDNGRGLLVG